MRPQLRVLRQSDAPSSLYEKLLYTSIDSSLLDFALVLGTMEERDTASSVYEGVLSLLLSRPNSQAQIRILLRLPFSPSLLNKLILQALRHESNLCAFLSGSQALLSLDSVFRALLYACAHENVGYRHLLVTFRAMCHVRGELFGCGYMYFVGGEKSSCFGGINVYFNVYIPLLTLILQVSMPDPSSLPQQWLLRVHKLW